MDPACIAVAYSGGRDSTALLHATVVAARAQGIRVLALHVHHGLSAQADAWLIHCEAQCRRWRKVGHPVDFLAERLAGVPAAGASVEAWARAGRYQALAEMARKGGARIVLLAHHQRDQAETFLLQALRGAGAKGLASMPKEADRDGVLWQRPWLDKPRDEIDAYVRRHRLKYIEDDSNADPRYARNRLRLEVWPALAAAFTQVDATLARSATWAQQADALMEEIAGEDLSRVAAGEALSVVDWSALSAARRGNALRVWIQRQTGAMPSANTVLRLSEELKTRKIGRWPAGRGELRLHRGVVRWHPTATLGDDARQREMALAVLGPGRYALPGWNGSLGVEAANEGGVPLAWVAQLELRPRTGGERFQAGLGRPPRSLKKQFQGAGLSPWQRDGPLIYSGGQLVYVPGLGLDARVIGLPGQAMVRLEWQPAGER